MNKIPCSGLNVARHKLRTSYTNFCWQGTEITQLWNISNKCISTLISVLFSPEYQNLYVTSVCVPPPLLTSTWAAILCEVVAGLTGTTHGGLPRAGIPAVRQSSRTGCREKQITAASHEHYGVSTRRQLDCLFNNLFRLKTKISMLCIAALLWAESTDDWWIPL